ncbi:MAG: DUF2339 domain-containing protein [Armatimonadetes bacterium]|nr:DUF2339 domain-containing protein [Armatimonadota bacterium]
MTDETRRELEAIKSELYRLSYRVRALEEQLTRESREPDVGANLRVRPEPTAETPIRPEPTAATRVRPELSLAPPPPATPLDEEAQSFERVLGGKVALYTGLTLLFLATAFFLGWAWTQLSPAGRLTLGYVGGALLMGLGMLALTTCKLFLYDLGFLQMPYRALSFAGLGLALIGVAWLYSRFGTADAPAN